MAEPDQRHALILGPSRIGEGTILAPDVTIGHPGKSSFSVHGNLTSSLGAVVGRNCVLRSGTVVYEETQIGDRVQTGHHAVIREKCTLGDGCVIGIGTVVREHATLGRNVRLMQSVVISEMARLGSDIFIGSNVSFTASRHMTGALEAAGKMTEEEAARVEGFAYLSRPSVIVEDQVRIGSNSAILANVRLGEGCVVAAGSVVADDVPPRVVVAGNPARVVKRLTE